MLLSAADGSGLCEKDFTGSGIQSLLGITGDEDRLYVVGRIAGSTLVDGAALSSDSPKYSDAILLVLSALDGQTQWVATISGDKDAISSVLRVQAGSIYMDCHGGCRQVRTTVSQSVVPFDGLYDGGVAKLSTDGMPVWTADVDLRDTGRHAGIAVTADPVYVQYMAWESETYGDATFTDRGNGGIFIAKLNADTGVGLWVGAAKRRSQ